MPAYCEPALELLQGLCKPCKYTNWYFALCRKAALRAATRKEAKTLLTYVEAHHIVPNAFKLVGKRLSWNLVYFTPREHFICHVLLAKIVIDERHRHSMLVAFLRMSGRVKCNRSRTYQKLREAVQEARSNFEKQRPRILSAKQIAMYAARRGKPLTEAQLAGHSRRRGQKINKRITPEFLAAHKARRGRARSEAEIRGQQQRLLHVTTCHCGMTCTNSNYKRWHGDNCKRRYLFRTSSALLSFRQLPKHSSQSSE